MSIVQHTGGCHCGAVRFKFQASPHLQSFDCNCSICCLKRNVHCIVPSAKFTLEQGQDQLATYQFNTGVAKHTFCRVCGICPFYRPRSNPDGFAVTTACIDEGTVLTETVKRVDARSEDAWQRTAGAMSHLSKESLHESHSH